LTDSTPAPGDGSRPFAELAGEDGLQPDPESWLPPPQAPPYRLRGRYFLASVLLLLTFVSTTTLGAIVYLTTRTDETTTLMPLLSARSLRAVWSDPSLLATGLSFALPLLFILMCHELGHYLACRYYRIPATLPYFLPSPFFIGTFGAFIKIRGRIPGRRELFDVGIAGPFAGFAALIPFLVLGMLWSAPAAITPAAALQPAAGLYVPGASLAFAGLSWLFYGPLPPDTVLNLHPFALAAWIGLLATSLNLIPLGQLDGGHVLYALIGNRQRRLMWPLWLGLLALGVMVWRGWLIWCVLLLVMGLRHPPVSQEQVPLDRRRRRLSVLAFVLFLVSFTPRPLDLLLIVNEAPPPTVLASTSWAP